MSDFDNPSPRHDESVRAGHEVTDVSMRGIVWFGIILVIVGILIHIGLAVLFDILRAREQAHDPLPSPLADLREPVSGPMLEEDPGAELKAMKDAQSGLLTSYGWVDRKQNIVHIPIDLAMKLLQDQFPVHEGGQDQAMPESQDSSAPTRVDAPAAKGPGDGQTPPGEDPDRATIPQSKTGGAESGAGAPTSAGSGADEQATPDLSPSTPEE